MAVVSAARGGRRRPVRLALLVLLAALATVVSLPGQTASTTPRPWGTDAAADGSVVKVVAPARAVGRLAAEPSPLGVHGSADFVPLGTLPSATPPPALLRLGDQHISVMPRLRAALRPAVGDRAPPVRLSDQ